MVKKLLVTFLIIATFNSCSLDDNNPNFSIATLAIKEAIVPEAFEFGQVYNITVFYDLPDDCHSFYDLFYQYDGSSRIVAINSIVRNDISCAEVITEKEFTFAVEASQQEDYTFKFWKGTDSNGNDIFDEVIVPVNF